MVNSIRGTPAQKSNEGIILLSGAFEWDIAMPSNDISDLPEGLECRILTWLYHREDQMRLFGFLDETRRNTFLELIKVEGIGPKAALKIMGGISQSELEHALESEDVGRLEEVPGLGKKTAQKMLLALRGKLVSAAAAAVDSPYMELVQALTDMGYDKRAVQDALAYCEKNLPSGMQEAEREKLLFKNTIVYLSGPQ